jgi:hypothetical protein
MAGGPPLDSRETMETGSQSMSAHNTPSKLARIERICRHPVVRTLVAIALILPFAEPFLLSAGWHATHSSVQRYGKYKIKVPWPYVLFKRGDRALLFRARTVPHWIFYKFAVISIEPPNEVNEAFDVNPWKEQVVQVFKKHGENVSGSFNTPMAGAQVACVQVTENHPEIKYYVICRGEDGSTIEYFGDGDGLRRMKSLLSGITLIGK